ncbi:CBS domain-containing protein [Microbispora sp. RL4-1S]|uniref:CBS domain-containing protein n=1 Tax=Microbispora oryzae TaxID=2806554 RepID=A0A941AJ83_9ACTN|nr:CBS domain-containing protein [Microbispora oryzae]MBP2703933.1 CBS domain-containing protein [Microbispora oryzae]
MIGTRRLTAADVMSRIVLTVAPDESPLMAWELMRRAGVHHIPVVDGNRRLHGVLTRLDLAMGWSGGPADLARREVREFLGERRLPRVRMDAPLDCVAATMLDAGRDAVPVVDEHGRTAGIITTVDVLRAVAGRISGAPGRGRAEGAMFRLEPVLPS